MKLFILGACAGWFLGGTAIMIYYHASGLIISREEFYKRKAAKEQSK